MTWDFDNAGSWTAWSRAYDELDVPFMWVIAVCDDGTFSVNESDPELTRRRESFQSLADAKLWCASEDERLFYGGQQSSPNSSD